MLTQIEIDGFKTFKNFKVELAPFQVIVGPNGSGKSNLFDALQLLSRLAEMDLYTAFQGLRGNADESFTKNPDGQTSERILIAVEMLVDRKMRDDLGREFEIDHTRLRYELEIAQHIDDEDELDQLYVKHELLKIISIENDDWCKKNNIKSHAKLSENDLKGDEAIFSFSKTDKEYGELIVHRTVSDQLYSEDDPPNIIEAASGFDIVLGRLGRTVLSSSVASMPQAIAARTELRSLKLLHLNPDVLRQYCSVKAPHTASLGWEQSTSSPGTYAEGRQVCNGRYLAGYGESGTRHS